MNSVMEARRWQMLTVLAAAFFMTILDSTIVVTALPSIGPDLGLGSAGQLWIVTGYVLAYGGLLLFCGRTADLLGRKRLFMTGNALWVLASVLCGAAPSGEILITGRVLQGIAAAVIAPAALSLVMVAFPQGAERNKALSVWGGLGGVGATAGLLLGGVITDGLGWPWIFFVNVPVGIGVLAFSAVLLRESRVSRSGTFDAAGAVTVTSALAALVYAITQIPEIGWTHPRTLGLFLAALVLGGLFVVVENRSAAPLVPFRALRSRVLVGGNLLIFTAGMAVDGMLITLTSFVQRELGWTALQFGLLAAVMTVTSVVAIVFAERSATRFGVRRAAVSGGTLLAVAGLLLVAAAAGVSPLAVMIAALLVFGAGMGAAFVSSQIAALTGVREEHSGLASGLVESSFHIGAGLGVAIATSLALVGGYAAAFAATVAAAAVGVIGGVTLFRRSAGTEAPARAGLEPAPATSPTE